MGKKASRYQCFPEKMTKVQMGRCSHLQPPVPLCSNRGQREAPKARCTPLFLPCLSQVRNDKDCVGVGQFPTLPLAAVHTLAVNALVQGLQGGLGPALLGDSAAFFAGVSCWGGLLCLPLSLEEEHSLPKHSEGLGF